MHSFILFACSKCSPLTHLKSQGKRPYPRDHSLGTITSELSRWGYSLWGYILRGTPRDYLLGAASSGVPLRGHLSGVIMESNLDKKKGE